MHGSPKHVDYWHCLDTIEHVRINQDNPSSSTIEWDDLTTILLAWTLKLILLERSTKACSDGSRLYDCIKRGSTVVVIQIMFIYQIVISMHCYHP